MNLANLPGREDAVNQLGNQLYKLRILGFKGLSKLALESAQLENILGAFMLLVYPKFLADPILQGGGFNNYTFSDVKDMLLLKLLPEKVGTVWSDVLSSSPASSSISSFRTGLDTVELKGTELLKLIEDFADDENATSLRKNVLSVNRSMSRFDISSAVKSFEKVDQVVMESINSEIQGYVRKGSIASHLMRLGKTFTTMATAGLTMLSGVMAGLGKFEWVAATLIGTGASAWIRERLDEIKAEDIVKWWSSTWPFEDPGIGFVIWEKAH